MRIRLPRLARTPPRPTHDSTNTTPAGGARGPSYGALFPSREARHSRPPPPARERNVSQSLQKNRRRKPPPSAAARWTGRAAIGLSDPAVEEKNFLAPRSTGRGKARRPSVLRIIDSGHCVWLLQPAPRHPSPDVSSSFFHSIPGRRTHFSGGPMPRFTSSCGPRSRCARPASVDSFAIEELEGRLMLSVFTVTSTADAGPGSLRQAILDANAAAGPDDVRFDIPGAAGAVR